MRDFCCPMEFICEYYLTFSKSLLCVILCLSRQENYAEILKNQRALDRGKGDYKMLRDVNINPYLHLKWCLECFQIDLLPKAEESVILLTRERYRTVKINSGHHTYSIKVEKPSEPERRFQIWFWHFIPFNMNSFS